VAERQGHSLHRHSFLKYQCLNSADPSLNVTPECNTFNHQAVEALKQIVRLGWMKQTYAVSSTSCGSLVGRNMPFSEMVLSAKSGT